MFSSVAHSPDDLLELPEDLVENLRLEFWELVTTVKIKDDEIAWLIYRTEQETGNKNSSGDEIANVNFYAVRPEATRIRWNSAK